MHEKQKNRQVPQHAKPEQRAQAVANLHKKIDSNFQTLTRQLPVKHGKVLPEIPPKHTDQSVALRPQSGLIEAAGRSSITDHRQNFKRESVMLAVSITNIGDIQLAQALVAAVGDHIPLYLNFASEQLLEHFGPVRHKHGCDVAYFLMHGTSFSGFVSFSAPPNVDQLYNLTLVSFFNDIGVPTVEIQHGLFQYGINNLDHTLRCGFDPNGGGWGLPFKYPAKHLLTWGGEEGIGYLKSIRPEKEHGLDLEDGFILVTSNLNWHLYGEYDQLCFVNCLLSLVVRHPEENFVWKPHGAEWMSKFKWIFDMAFAQKLPNLRIITPQEAQLVSAEDLVPHCKMGISTVSTTLVDYDLLGKPVLVYDRGPIRHMLDKIQAKTFSGTSDLFVGFKETLADPSNGYVTTGILPLDANRLLCRLEAIQIVPRGGFNPKALEYLRSLGVGHPSPPCDRPSATAVPVSMPVSTHEIGVVLPEVRAALVKPGATYSLEDILRSIEQRIDIRTDQLHHHIEVVRERTDVVQRSTLAFKLKKLGRRLGLVKKVAVA